MIAGSATIPVSVFWDDYYESLHIAHDALREAFESSGLTQDELADRIGADKSLVSKRLNGSENLTIKTLSQMGTGMGYRLVTTYVPYDQCGMINYFHPTISSVAASTTAQVNSVIPIHTTGTSANWSTYSSVPANVEFEPT